MTLIRFEDAVPPESRAGAGSAQGDARSQAWRREMESAQLALWLDQRVIGAGAPRNTDSSVAPPMTVHVSSLVSASEATAVAAGSSPGAAAQAGRSGDIDRANPPVRAAAARAMTGTGAADRVIAAAPALLTAQAGLTSAGSAANGTNCPEVVPAPVQLPARLAAAISELTGIAVATVPSPQQAQAILPAMDAAVLRSAGSPAPESPTGPSDVHPAAAPARHEEQSVRLHCQLGADGVMVWIGSVAAAAVNAQALAAHLKQVLARQSMRLSSFIHNGQPVPVDGLPSFELFPTKSNQESK